MFDLRLSGIFALTAFLLSLMIGLVSGATMPMLIVRPLIFAVVFFAFAAFIKIVVGRFLPELMEDSVDMDDFSPGSRINILEGDGPSDSTAMTEGFVSGALGPAPTAGAKPDDSEDGLGDISELSRRSLFSPSAEARMPAGESFMGVDQNAKERYTDSGGPGDAPVPDFSNMFTPDPSFEAHSGGQVRATGTGAGSGIGPASVASAAPKAGGSFDSDDTLPDLDSMAEAFMSDSSEEEQGGGTSEYSSPGSPRRPASSSKKAPEWTQDFNPKDIAMGLRTVLSKEKEG